jgi:hypothetical protein
LENLVRDGMISFETAMQFAANAGNLRLVLADLAEAQEF